MELRITIDFTWVLVGIGVLAFVAIIICVACCWFRLKKRRAKRQSMDELAETGNTSKANEYNMGVLVPVPSATAAILRNPVPNLQSSYPQCCESPLEIAMKQALFNMAEGLKLASHRLDIMGPLGNGHSGVVYKAQLTSKNGKRKDTVAAKTVQDGASVDDMTQFLQEAMRMRSFSHNHVLTMMGIVDLDGRPYVVLPYMANGDLKTHLLDDKQVLSVLDLLWISLQVVEGMVYLANSKFVHRDLAARNCMVSEKGVVKVADFGLSYDLFEDDYYRADGESKALPAKWMAPECFSEKKFSEKSDVWSYGVLLWEVITRGKVPYSGKKHHEVIEYVAEGGRLDRPEHCHPDIYDVMSKCWRQLPKERPSFEDIRLMMNLLIDGTSNTSTKRKKSSEK